MGYAHIDNLYKDTRILDEKEVYALEKIHGTSAHVTWDGENLSFFSGGEKYERFVACFDQEALKQKFWEVCGKVKTTVYGEAYGGSCQGMSATYGKELKFVAFEALVGHGDDKTWLDVPDAEKLVLSVGLDFVPYERIRAKLADIDAERDRDSVQAVKNGMGSGHKREGVVLRPINETIVNNDHRLVAKHKHESFRETTTPRVVNEEKVKLRADAQGIADEWVTEMRLTHVLDKLELDGKKLGIEATGDVVRAMVEDVKREAAGEFEWGKEAGSAIGKRAAKLFHGKLKSDMNER